MFILNQKEGEELLEDAENNPWSWGSDVKSDEELL